MLPSAPCLPEAHARLESVVVIESLHQLQRPKKRGSRLHSHANGWFCGGASSKRFITKLLPVYDTEERWRMGHGHMYVSAAQTDASTNYTKETTQSCERNVVIPLDDVGGTLTSASNGATYCDKKPDDCENNITSFHASVYERGVQDPRQSLDVGTILSSISHHRADRNSALRATTEAADAGPRFQHFWRVVQRDINIISRTLNWSKEVALPSVAENMHRIVTLQVLENCSLSPRPSTFIHVSYSGLTVFELMAADMRALMGYIFNALDSVGVWTIPLELHYDPDKIAAYFNRRPHALLFRIFQIASMFGLTLLQVEIEKALNFGAKQILNDKVHARTRSAKLLRGLLVKLGPTFIKVGQSLATRPDMVGADVAEVLAELQDNLPPFSTQKAHAIIENELGKPLNNVFETLSGFPVAAASFGQVYKGRTVDGLDVAVKVQRPNLLHTIALDIYILRMGLGVIKRIFKRRSDLKSYADGLGQGLFGELDYHQEAANALEFKAAHANLSFLEVPSIITSLSTTRILTMEWMNGDRPAKLLLTAKGVMDGDQCSREHIMEAKRRLFSLVNKGVEASLVQLFDTGLLHADPHPGNILYTKDGKMIFLDFGLLCRMEKHHQLSMIASVAHIVNADWKNFVCDLADMEVLPSGVNQRAIALELEDQLGDAVPQEGVPNIKFSKVLARVLAIALKYHFRMPPYFVLVLRSIASLEGLALAVDPDFKVFAASYPFVLQKLLIDQSAPLRRVLISLVLSEERHLRWDRLAAFATLARQHTMKRVAIENGLDLQNFEVSGHDSNNLNRELIQILVNLLFSENGAILQLLVLEADAIELARSLNSKKAEAFRCHVTVVLANVLYNCGKDLLEKHTMLKLQDSSPVVPMKMSKRFSYSDKLLENEMQSVISTPATLSFSILQNRRIHFMLRSIFSRLIRKPVLMLLTGWTCFKLLCCAMAIAAHRLVVAVSIGKSNAPVSSSCIQLTPC